MTDHALTETEMHALLEAIVRAKNWAAIDVSEEICYGNPASVRRASERDRIIGSILDAVPKRTLEEYDRRRRKEQADRLRAQADTLELGGQHD